MLEVARILVGVDGSAASDAALRWAIQVSLDGGEPISLLHVIERPAAGVLEACPEVERDHAADVLARALERIPAALRPRVTTEILVGPLEAILAAVAGPDEILAVGSHKTGIIRGRVWRSRALVIAAHTSAPLAIIPVETGATRQGIVVGLVNVLDWRSQARHGAFPAARTGEPLQIVGVTEPVPGIPTTEAELVSRGEVLLAAAAALVRAEYPPVQVRTRASVRHAAEAFLDAARLARLLVIGAPRDARTETFVGSVADDILLNLNAPTLVVPVDPALAHGSVADGDAAVPAA